MSDGVGVSYTGARGRLKSEYEVRAGANVSSVRIGYEAAGGLRVEADGSLRVETADGDWLEGRPIAYQLEDGRVRDVPVRYVVFEDGTVGFDLGAYDLGRPVVIDPELTFSTVLGGYGQSVATSMVLDGEGNLYVAGYTDAPDFPVVAPGRGRAGGVDVLVVKIAAGGARIVYSTYLGGSGDDRAFSIRVDATGAAVVCGWTTSVDFPVQNAYRSTSAGGKDAFVLRLSPQGDRLLFSTYLGGSGQDIGYAVDVDGSGVWVGGETQSYDFPVRDAAQTVSGGRQDAFLARFGLDGALVRSTYFGGAGDESLRALVLTGVGDVVIGGGSDSVEFAMPAGAWQRTVRGGQDAFVVKCAGSDGRIIAGTYLGGSAGGWQGPEIVSSLALDGSGNVIAGGQTPSVDFPLAGAYRSVFGGTQEGFVAKIRPALDGAFWSTFLGGGTRDSVDAVAVDSMGSVVAGGRTTASDFPNVSGSQTILGGGYDGFVSVFAGNGASLTYSSFLGGNGAEGVSAFAVGASGALYAAGVTSSTNFVSLHPLQSLSGSSPKIFVTAMKFAGGGPVVQGATPAAGQGMQTMLEVSVAHSGGAGSVERVEVRVGPAGQSSGTCWVKAYPALSRVSLMDNAGTGQVNLSTGAPGFASNSQCSLNPAGSRIIVSGQTLTLQLSLGFRTGYAGTHSVQATATDTAGGNAPWTTIATHQVPASAANAAPVLAAVAPSTGQAYRQVFTFTFRDSNGWQDFASALALVNNVFTAERGCFVLIDLPTSKFYLATDHVDVYQPAAFGSGVMVENSQCQLREDGSSVSFFSDTMTVKLDLTFKAAWSGSRDVYAWVSDRSGAASAWSKLGGFIVGTPPVVAQNQPPSVGTVTPSSGTGTAQKFTLTFSDSDGGGDIESGQFILNTSLSAAGACALVIDRPNSRFQLLSDSGSGGSDLSFGSAGSLQNSQCEVKGPGSTISVSGTVLTVAFDIVFKTAFTGAKSVWAAATDTKSQSAAWKQVGTYAVTASVSPIPAISNVVPHNGSGSGTKFTFTFSDAQGWANLDSAVLLLNGPYTGERGCFLVATPRDARVYLAGDLSGWTGATLETSVTLQNSQCFVRMSSSNQSTAGNTWALTLDIGFKSGFTGTKSIWGHVVDVDGNKTPEYASVSSYTITGSQVP